MDYKEIKDELHALLHDFADVKHAYVYQHMSAFVIDDDNKNALRKLKNVNIPHRYHSVYTRALKAVKVFIPDRYQDFIYLYANPNRKKDFSLDSYDISLGLTGITKTIQEEAYIRQMYTLLDLQEGILRSILPTLDSKLFDIQGEIQYELFMRELDAAEHLLKNKFVRAAGAMAGVALEAHLKSVCLNRNIKITKRDDLSKYNDYLKSESIIDQPKWRKIQYLTDIRNACDHKRDAEPTKEQVAELINGTKQIISEVL
ncbi:MAG: HEPN domain-containing protein [Muribaculaceae bacterium]|nr:HEPN domain-containing protein [Muribaculaceae bacterium]